MNAKFINLISVFDYCLQVGLETGAARLTEGGARLVFMKKPLIDMVFQRIAELADLSMPTVVYGTCRPAESWRGGSGYLRLRKTEAGPELDLETLDRYMSLVWKKLHSPEKIFKTILPKFKAFSGAGVRLLESAVLSSADLEQCIAALGGVILKSTALVVEDACSGIQRSGVQPSLVNSVALALFNIGVVL